MRFAGQPVDEDEEEPDQSQTYRGWYARNNRSWVRPTTRIIAAEPVAAETTPAVAADDAPAAAASSSLGQPDAVITPSPRVDPDWKRQRPADEAPPIAGQPVD